MILFDTDVLTLFVRGNAIVCRRVTESEIEVRIPIISRIEVLQGRFSSILKAANGEQLGRAIANLVAAEAILAEFQVVTLDAGAIEEFDRLLTQKKLKKIGRASPCSPVSRWRTGRRS